MTECPKCWMPMDDFSSMCVDCMPNEEEITSESNREWFKDNTKLRELVMEMIQE